MADIFVSYARSTAPQAQRIAEALRALGYRVWRDDELPAHRSYAEVIEERLKAAKAVVVIWSAEAAKSEWVQSEADRARNDRKLVQLTVDGTALPMPFDRIQCADLSGWSGDLAAPGWRKVISSIADLVGGAVAPLQISGTPELKLPNKPSIAVLPFSDMTGATDQDYFADGMVEEITNALSRFKSLFVIASGSTSRYRDAARNLEAIGRELGVRYLLEGSVRKAAGNVRIAVKLVDATDGAQIWTERFDDTLKDVFDLQDRVANRVANTIGSKLEVAEILRAEMRPTSDLDAYDLFLRALPLWRAWERTSITHAIELLDAAIARDPKYAVALAMAGFCKSQHFLSGWAEDLEECRRRGLDYCRRAVRLDQDDAQVLRWASAGIMNFADDIAEAKRLSDRALELLPGSAECLHHNGWINAVYGDPALAIIRIEEVQRLDPQSPQRLYHLTSKGIALFALRRFEDATDCFAEVAAILPDYPTPQVFLAACYAHLGRLGEAHDVLQQIKGKAITDGVFAFIREPERKALLQAGIKLAERGVL